MENVYELIKKVYVGGYPIHDSQGLFLKKEKAYETKAYLEKYNPIEKFEVVCRKVD